MFTVFLQKIGQKMGEKVQCRMMHGQKGVIMNIKQLEELAMNAWPSLQTRLYDGWVLRFAEGYTKRANSVNLIYKSELNPDEKIDFCEMQYGALHLPTIFKLTESVLSQGIDRKLEERGYKKIDETSVRVLGLEQYACGENPGITVEDRFSGRWLDGFFKCSGTADKKEKKTARKMIENICTEVICVSRQIGEEIVGCGFGTVERGHVGIFNIAVDRNFRSRGYGKEIMDGILSQACRRGARTAYLQVMAGNLPAEKLYDKLGFTEVYRYWYRCNKC